ncbi:tetratricopeptide repeat protein [Pseudodesulfovibrio sp. JC047]|uniref:tetratricopeptide repeat protein n=1 Tax=Pseudodesulfovibrio sp. JC047 TaxID=2683199 RepID=UPI0013D14DCA|nr:tetratricopeptide repeat protein [Pseudodesulfovibrio sp. JC047]NDV20090.1 tetratricopeptide repeat protein [Pseudodesulfovibrio sp. JC047]
MAGKYDSIVYDFFSKLSGSVVLITEDQLFKKTLATTLFKVLGTKRNCLFAYEGVQQGLKKIQELEKRSVDTIVFIERILAGRPSTDTIITLKRVLPNLKIVVLVGETKRENIAYFYEIGVNNVISKPASINNIIEKMAFTVQPQGKLSEYMSIGKRCLAAGKFMDAMQIADKILRLKPESPAGLMLKGDVFLSQGDPKKALECFHRAHDNSKLYLEPIKKLVGVYKKLDEEKALEYMKKLDKLSPLNAERKTDIGKIYVHRKKMELAEKYFDQAVEAATTEAMSLISSVVENISEAVQQASPRMAEKYLRQVLEAKGKRLDRSDITLFNKLGIALRGQGKWKEAIENYIRALRISPDDEGLFYNTGMAYLDGGERTLAAKCFENALQKNPDFYRVSEVVSMNMGLLFYELREYDKAVPLFENAVALNPTNMTAQRKLAAISDNA